MSDTKDTEDKTLSVERKPTLSLKRNVEHGTVRQSFSHGRTKAVVVETKKKRRAVGPAPEKAEARPPAPSREAAPQKQSRQRSGLGRSSGQGSPAPQGRTLTESEREARERVLREAAERDKQDLERAEKEAREREEIEARERAIAEERRKREAEEAAAAQEAAAAAEPQPAPEEAADTGAAEPAEASAAAAEAAEPSTDAAKTDAAEEDFGTGDGDDSVIPQAPAQRGVQIVSQPRHVRAARAKAEKEKEIEKEKAAAAAAQPDVAALEAAAAKSGTGKAAPRAKASEGDDSGKGGLKPVRRPRGADETAKPSRGKTGDDRRRSKLTITSAFSDDDERGRSLAAARRRREREKAKAAGAQTPREKVTREVIIPETITIQELANRMAERAVDVIKLLMKQGQMMKINDVIDADTAELIVDEMGHSSKRVSESDVEEGLFADDDDPATLVSRPPVVTIMGHVDHGKTSLLDALREANVVSGEAGGITQHIGAYQVEKNDQLITFIDTPGHAAFTAMRARGAKSTDIVILVVAADDGVMPQTIEAINHARAAGVPIIVAINKIDRPDADPNRVRTELLQHEIVVESMGGEVLDVEVSALKKLNLEGILEAILLQSEILELKANPARPGEGTVIEAKLDKGRGPVATVLVQRGTVKVGDVLVGGSEWGRVRALIDDRGEQVKDAGPSKPVEVLGMQATPEAGDQFSVVENEARAREITEYRQRKRRELSQVRGARGSLEQMMSQLKESDLQEMPILIKGDVQGSVEAIVGALEKLSTDEVAVRVIHAGVGGITESDVTLATASGAAIIGFNVRANKQARDSAEQTGADIRYYNIIYDLVDDVKAAMSGMLSPERRETFIGYAAILQVFDITKVGKVAGCRVTDGTVERGAGVRLLRDDVVIHEGKLAILKRFKDEVKEVVAGQECGMMFENYQDIREGDQIECFRVEEVARTL